MFTGVWVGGGVAMVCLMQIALKDFVRSSPPHPDTFRITKDAVDTAFPSSSTPRRRHLSLSLSLSLSLCGLQPPRSNVLLTCTIPMTLFTYFLSANQTKTNPKATHARTMTNQSRPLLSTVAR